MYVGSGSINVRVCGKDHKSAVNWWDNNKYTLPNVINEVTKYIQYIHIWYGYENIKKFKLNWMLRKY